MAAIYGIRLLLFSSKTKEREYFSRLKNAGNKFNIKETIKSAKSSPKVIVNPIITRPGNIFNTVGHTCCGETRVEGLVELWSPYDVTLVRLDSVRSC